MKKISLFLLLFAIALVGSAQESAEKKEFNNSLRLQFLGFHRGTLGFEYERAWKKQFAITAEASYIGINDSRLVSNNRAEGFLGGVGFKMYGAHYRDRQALKPKQPLLGGFYGMGRLALEHYSVDYGGIYATINGISWLPFQYTNTTATAMLGLGINTNIYRRVSIDVGYNLGYQFLNNTESESLTVSSDLLRQDRFFHGIPYGNSRYIVMRLNVNVGINF
jgi:hypothetical protein